MAGEDRTFKQLQKEKDLQELNCFATAVTEEYATSEMEYSQTNIAQDNHLTPKGLRDLMDYAIETELVSIATSEQVLRKAIQNQQRKAQEAGGSSIRHHNDLMRKRRIHRMVKIATDIAEHPSDSIHHFTEKYKIESDRHTKKILETAIVDNIVSDEVMEKLIERSLKGNETESAKQYFTDLRDKRKENQAKSS